MKDEAGRRRVDIDKVRPEIDGGRREPVGDRLGGGGHKAVNPQLGTLADFRRFAPDQQLQVHDLLTGARYLWHGSRSFVQIDPHQVPAHVFRVRRRVRSERDFDYFI